MILVHDIFVCKPGNASKLAKMFKKAMEGQQTTIMTDVTGQYNRVIMVTTYDDLTAYEKFMKEYTEQSNQRQSEEMQGYQEMYLTGSREIYKIW